MWFNKLDTVSLYRCYKVLISSVHFKLKSGAIFMVIDLSELNLCIGIENGGTEYKKLHNRCITNIKNLRMTLPLRPSLDPPLNSVKGHGRLGINHRKKWDESPDFGVGGANANFAPQILSCFKLQAPDSLHYNTTATRQS